MSGFLGPVQLWAIIGILLIIADIFSLTFFLFFLGVGALVTAVFIQLGIAQGLGGQLLCFALSSLVVTVLFRSTVKRMFGRKAGPGDYSEYVGQRATVSVPIPPGGEGKVSYRGSDWIAFSESASGIAAGAAVTIVAVEGIKFKVNPVS